MEETSNFDIEEELKKLPNSPGVYLMHDSRDEILYVGKAVNLHNRVRQYFRNGHGHNNSPKITKMVDQIAYFEYIITSSEVEALILECNLIKEHRPKYNTMMTDDKGYPYIRLTVEEAYPRLLYSHTMKRDKSKYFGPFTSGKAVKDTIELLNKVYNLRTCNKRLPQEIGKDRPCLYYQIGQCKAPCNNYISSEEYKKQVDGVISFLNGNHKDIVNKINADMKEYAEQLEFEKAAECRDLLESIKFIADKQKVNSLGGDDRDIIAYAAGEKDIVVTIFFVRDGKLLGRENHHMNGGSEDAPGEILAAFIKQFYLGTPYLPKEIVVQDEIEDAALIEEFLTKKKGSNVKINVPKKGDKSKMVSLAKDNAALVLNQDMERIKRQEKRTVGAAREIADALGISSADRMEAFDISNISGTLSVASMVVFEKGMPKRNGYRKFRLRTVTGPDDYASMKEVLSRRFTDEKLDVLPDVIMMDGGKGQVNIALMVLDSLGLDIPVCGMVKDDKHRTRALYYNNEEIQFPRGSQAMLMVTSLQDEAHRFAIEYHRQLRSKNQVKSVLDDIPGVGDARRKQLMKHFKDVENIKKASADELAALSGIPERVAKTIYNFFHPQ
ncbi:MAG: excinuclease ABC subunit UvrC [Clostridium sp.]|nr:excinuclease ABC subunit UvrC [Clostridium sp.]MCM1398410.1 excinuclease ABC subunit UvrC [Clostridium sp.]MCM1458925.1 excinuclease ABC subunit UvrC [Bacteroides sp.]